MSMQQQHHSNVRGGGRISFLLIEHFRALHHPFLRHNTIRQDQYPQREHAAGQVAVNEVNFRKGAQP